MVALGWDLHKRGSQSQLDGDWLLAQIRFLLFFKKVDRQKAREYLHQLGRPVAVICEELLNLENPTLESGDYLLASAVEQQRLRLEKGLSHLGTIAVIAPFVGLFGTVVGISKTFADVAKMGKAGIEVVSAGVSEALIATAVGLLVAIISVVLFNSFKKRFDDQVARWELTGRTLLTLLTSELREPDTLLRDTSEEHPTASAETFLEG
jgi:biopolymer transport protein ExbB/TolQ